MNTYDSFAQCSTVDFPLELKRGEPLTEGVFEGYASIFDMPIPHPLYGTDIIKPGAFAKSIATKGVSGIKCLWQHDPTEPVGKWLTLQEDARGLRVKGQLLLELAKAREAHTLLKNEVLDGLSIGFTIPPKKSELDAKKEVRMIHEVDLWEVSLVTFPADPRARITDTKSTQTVAEILAEIRKARTLLQGWR